MEEIATLTTDANLVPVTTVLGKPGCFGCTKTAEFFDREGVPFEYFDVTQPENAQHLAAMRELGYNQAPVVITQVFGAGDVHWSGLNPPKLREVADRVKEARQLEQLAAA
jgi:glutaredoxin